MKSITQSSSCRFRDSHAWISLLEACENQAWFSQLLDFSLFWLGKAWQCLHGILHMWNYWCNFGFFHPFIWVQTNNIVLHGVFVGNDASSERNLMSRRTTDEGNGLKSNGWKDRIRRREGDEQLQFSRVLHVRKAECWLWHSALFKTAFHKVLYPCWHCGHWDHGLHSPEMKLLEVGKDF